MLPCRIFSSKRPQTLPRGTAPGLVGGCLSRDIPRPVNWPPNRNVTARSRIRIGYLGVERWQISSVVRKITELLCFFCDTQSLADRLDFKSSRPCAYRNDRTRLIKSVWSIQAMASRFNSSTYLCMIAGLNRASPRS